METEIFSFRVIDVFEIWGDVVAVGIIEMGAVVRGDQLILQHADARLPTICTGFDLPRVDRAPEAGQPVPVALRLSGISMHQVAKGDRIVSA